MVSGSVVSEGLVGGVVRCPRCGRLGRLEVRVRSSNTYYYVRHEVRGGGGRRHSWCYLGPADYKNVTRTHNVVTFHGFVVSERELEYLNDLVDYIVEKYREVCGPSQVSEEINGIKCEDLLEVLKHLHESTKEVLGEGK